MPRVFEPSEVRLCAVMLDTEAESLTEQMALIFGNNRKYREFAERRAELWRAAKRLRKIAQ